MASLFGRTIDVLREITMDLPRARTIKEAADVCLREDRKMYVGIALVALAAMAIIVAN